jgi:hypothetical protein
MSRSLGRYYVAIQKIIMEDTWSKQLIDEIIVVVIISILSQSNLTAMKLTAT